MTRGFRRTGPQPVLTLLLSFGLTFPLAPAVAAQGAVNSAGNTTAQARMSLEALASLLDPTEYDVDELSLALAFEDAEVIASWVADNLRYQVYPGLLRGPQGTLVAGAGNALDQSVLLATLLLDAGYDVRVVLGELSDQDARTLVTSMFEESAARPGSSSASQAHDTGLGRLAAATGADPVSLTAATEAFAALELRDLPAFQEASAQAATILAELDHPGDTEATPELVAEAKQYAWVEYRLEQSAAWSIAQPAWPAAAAAPEVTGERFLDGEVPPELLHHLRIEVSIERKRGAEFETAALMTPWQRPVANLLGYPIVIGNTALDSNGASDLATLGAEMAESAFYAPVLNGSLAPGAMAFDLAGNLVPPDAAMSAMAGVFQTGASRMGDAIGALGAMGAAEEPEEPFALTAQWVDFVLVAPGGEETRHRRTVFDRRPPQARADGTLELLDESALLENLISTYVVMASGGAVSPAFVASQMYEQATFHLDVMDSLAELRSTGAVVDEEASLLEALADYVPKDHLELFAASDAIDHAVRGVAYRAEPSVMALVGTLTPTAEAHMTSGVDIIANSKRTLYAAGDDVFHDVQGGVLAGVWDTAVERAFLAEGGQAADNALNLAPPVGWTVLQPEVVDDLSAAVVPAQALTAVRADLSNGYAVVLPAGATAAAGPAPAATLSPGGAAMAPVPQSGPAAWSYWRVDLDTGETLGMNAAGRGASMTEFIVSLKVGLVLNSVLAVPGIALCMGSSASWTCYCDVIAFGAGMTLAGAVFSAFVAAEWALVAYAVVDIGIVGPVTTAIYTPPVCSAWARLGDPTRASRDTAAACWAA